MRRALFSIAATIMSLYMILTYKSTPIPAHNLASANGDASATEMTLPDDGSSDSESDDTEGDSGDGGDTDTTTTSTTSSSVPHASTTLLAKTGVTTSTAKPATTVRPTTTTVRTTTTTIAKRVFDGSVVQTNYGPVQVSITVQGSKIVGVKALQLPSGGTSTSINADAAPKLESQTLQAQSANINGVSGATYTSNGWKTSLAAALHAAGM